MEKSAIKNNWQTKRLKDICSAYTGRRPSRQSEEDAGYFSIGGEHITVNHRVDYDKNLWFISYKFYENLNSGRLDREFILLVKDGATIGKCCYFIPNRNKYISTINEHVFAIEAKKTLCLNRFLYYFLLSPNGQNQINNCITGAAQPGLNRSFLDIVTMSFPPLPIQQKIASILSAYDDLIELNQRRIKILEEMARLIYKEWFVKFRFPGYEKANMVESELGMMIPEGWEVRRLNEVVNTQYGYTESASDEPIGPKFLRVKDINKNSWIDWSTVPYCKMEELKFKDYSLKKGDIVIARMADPGKVGIIEIDISAVFASYLIRLSPKTDRIQSYYLFYSLTSPVYQGFILGASTGTTRASANAKVITDCNIVIPTIEIMQKFGKTISKIREMMTVAINQNSILRQSRDMLLPKLIGGEMDVSDLDIKLGSEKI